MNIEDKLFQYAQKQYSVLLSGLHGVGKTVLTEKTFEKMGWKYKTFNSATLNPYMDVTGVAQEGTTLNTMTNEEVACIVKRLPEHFASDELDAIFFDEISRAPKEVMNGLFQLLQFREINGYKLRRLKVIWGAYNPYNPDADESEQTYHVVPLDPAFEDRFRIHINLPYELNQKYLMNKHGEVSKPFIKWWNDLPPELRLKCSPRRLDESIQTYNDGFDLEDVLYNEELKLALPSLKNNLILLSNAASKKIFIDTLSGKTIDEAIEIINIENINLVMEAIKNKTLDIKFVQAINQDVLTNYIDKNPDSKLEKMILNYAKKTDGFELSDRAKNILYQRTESINFVIQENFSDFKTILNKENFEYQMDMLSDIGNRFLKSSFTLYLIERQNKGKISLNFDEMYEELKKYSFYKSMYVNLVHLWYKTVIQLKKQGDNTLQIKLLEKLTSNPVVACLSGYLLNRAIMDKDYHIAFEKPTVTSEQQSMQIISVEDEKINSTAKYFKMGYGANDKYINKLLLSVFDGCDIFAQVHVKINQLTSSPS